MGLVARAACSELSGGGARAALPALGVYCLCILSDGVRFCFASGPNTSMVKGSQAPWYLRYLGAFFMPFWCHVCAGTGHCSRASDCP